MGGIDQLIISSNINLLVHSKNDLFVIKLDTMSNKLEISTCDPLAKRPFAKRNILKDIAHMMKLYGALIVTTLLPADTLLPAVDEAQTDTPKPAIVSGNQEKSLPSFRHLLISLPSTIRARIEELLERGFHSSSPIYTNDEHLLSQDKTTHDCFGTIFWVLSGDAEQSPMKGRQLVRKLKELGYKKIIEFPSYERPPHGSIRQIAIETMNKNLISGDVVIFMSPPLWDNPRMAFMMGLERHHAALYLGAVGNHHAIFQKPNARSGPESPYELTTMDLLLNDGMGPVLYSTIEVWRLQR